ncbi:MAG: hypothetical protein QXR53_01035 [Candidatus Norongarragalinales archaeon]
MPSHKQQSPNLLLQGTVVTVSGQVSAKEIKARCAGTTPSKALAS